MRELPCERCFSAEALRGCKFLERLHAGVNRPWGRSEILKHWQVTLF